MSLERQQRDPLNTVLDRLRSSGDRTNFIYLHYEPHGHLYYNTDIHGENSTVNVGDMCKPSPHLVMVEDDSACGLLEARQYIKIVLLMTYSAAVKGKSHPALEKSPVVTPPGSEQGSTDMTSPAFIPDAPPEFRAREHDFFTSGRFFRIWARDGENVDVEIHNKDFILLDQKNKEGPGLLVRRHASEHCDAHKGSFNRNHISLKTQIATGKNTTDESASGPPATLSKKKIVYLEDDDDDVADNTYIELEHSYNIPFVKYKCINHGVLTPASLHDLRQYYVSWLTYHWRLDKTT